MARRCRNHQCGDPAERSLGIGITVTRQNGSEPRALIPTFPTPLWKRTLDLVLASAGLLVLLPLWPVIAVAIRIEDGGPVFFEHHRVGKGEEPFVTRKFRSMPVDNTVAAGQGRPDPADITAVGRVLRKTALDESPQLWDIVRGRMSLVGPRPLMVEQVERGLAGHGSDLTEIPGFHERHRVLPGLTGVAQVHGPWKLTYRRKFRYDAFYVRNRSLTMDLELIVRSILHSLRGAWPGSEDRTNSSPEKTCPTDVVSHTRTDWR